jgi:hypothetical protein
VLSTLQCAGDVEVFRRFSCWCVVFSDYWHESSVEASISR